MTRKQIIAVLMCLMCTLTFAIAAYATATAQLPGGPKDGAVLMSFFAICALFFGAAAFDKGINRELEGK